jgi:hypothetical protein
MRVRVSDPSLLSDPCNYLSRRGCAAVEGIAPPSRASRGSPRAPETSA